METDPEAKEELAREKREAEKAAKMAASDATHTSEEEKPKVTVSHLTSGLCKTQRCFIYNSLLEQKGCKINQA